MTDNPKQINFPEKIEKPWAAYGCWIGVEGIGRVLSYNKTSFQLQYSEDPACSLTSLSPSWVRSFKFLNEAVNYFLSNPVLSYDPINPKKSILKELEKNFPKAIAQEKKNELTALVNLLSNLTHSQSPPKCTENTKYQFGPCSGCIKQEKTC
jgi:hypothetical protein